MSTTTRRVLMSVAVLALTGCVCLSVLAIGGVGAGYLQLHQAPTAAPTARPAAPTTNAVPQGSPTGDRPAVETPTVNPTPDDAALPAEVVDQMETIEDQVVEIRGLLAGQDVPRFLLGPEQLRQRVMDDFFKDYTQVDAQEDGIVLEAFGLIPAGFDLLSMYIDLYSESIAGFYDQDEQVMYIVQGEDFQGAERLTYSHEFTHALQDQTYDIKDGLDYSEEACEGQSERCAGLQALIEGDASLVEQRWMFGYATEQDMLDLQESVANLESPVYDSAPGFIQQDLIFAYTKGLEFVESLYDRGGWPAIDAAYQAPPVSTEQILHPDQYPDDAPLNVSLPDLSAALGEDWRALDDETLGEWYTYLLLAHGSQAAIRLPEDAARKASAGWEGDRYAVFTRDSDRAALLVLSTQWDDADQAGEFVDAFSVYGNARWGDPAQASRQRVEWVGDGQASLVLQLGAQTVWLLAPDAQTASSLAALFQAP